MDSITDMKPKILALIGLIFIVSLASLSSCRLLKNAMTNSKVTQTGNNIVLEIIDKAECLRDFLPEHGIVGYLVNREGPLTLHTIDKTEIRYYHLAQYALTPVVIEDNLDHEFIVGHLTNPDELHDIITRFHLSIIKDCKNGFILFKQSNQ